MKLTRKDMELLEGFLMNHFRYAADFYDGVTSARAELVDDTDYENTIKTVFEVVLHTNDIAVGKLTNILRKSANWLVTSDASARRKLMFIYEEVLATVNFSELTDYARLEYTASAEPSSLSCWYPAQYTKQAQWLAIDILTHDIKTVANNLERHYCQPILASKKAFMTQLGVSFGLAVLSGVLRCMPTQHSEKQSLQQAISRLYQHHRRYDACQVFETALNIMNSLSDAEKTMSAIDINIVLLYACQLQDDDTFAHSQRLYDWFDVIFDGEALSNDIAISAQGLYQWIVLDVLPNASRQRLPTYMMVFDQFYATPHYLQQLGE